MAAFQDDIRRLTPQLEEAVRTRDTGSVRRLAHTVKGMVAFFEAPAVVMAVGALEVAAAHGDPATVGRLLAAAVADGRGAPGCGGQRHIRRDVGRGGSSPSGGCPGMSLDGSRKGIGAADESSAMRRPAAGAAAADRAVIPVAVRRPIPDGHRPDNRRQAVEVLDSTVILDPAEPLPADKWFACIQPDDRVRADVARAEMMAVGRMSEAGTASAGTAADGHARVDRGERAGGRMLSESLVRIEFWRCPALVAATKPPLSAQREQFRRGRPRRRRPRHLTGIL